MTVVESELERLEATVTEHLVDEDGQLERNLDDATVADEGGGGEPESESSPLRLAIAVGLCTVGTAVMAGGVFLGASPRIYAGIAGTAGVGLAVFASRLRKPGLANVVVVAGLFAIGLIAVVPSGLGNLGSLQSVVSAAVKNGNVTRPPVEFSVGWHAIIAWMLGVTGFTAAWVALAVRRPAIGIMIPLPVAAICGVSVPAGAQVPSGIAVLVLFAAALGILSSARAFRGDEERPPIGYELRKAGRGLLFIAVITAAMVGLAQTHVLFPKPVIDPTKQPQKPRVAPLDPAKDRVLFVADPPTGPFRTGSLDVFDGTFFRLPAFTDSRLKIVGKSGIVNDKLPTGSAATIRIGELSGAVLPTLPNTVGVVARANLAYDARNGNIRFSQGGATPGFIYQVAAAPLPKISDLRSDADPLPPDVSQFVEVPPPPPAVVDLLAQARAKATNKWDQYQFLYDQIINTVTADGTGAANSPVPPARVQDLLAGSKKGSPYEIVATEALVARWAGIPSRVAFGYDTVQNHCDLPDSTSANCHKVDNKFEFHPNDGATFVEIYFPHFEWLPINIPPKKSQPSLGSNPANQKVDPTIVPSDDIGVQVFLPTLVKAPSVLGRQIIAAFGIALPFALLGLLGYTLFPALRKSVVRSRRRADARASGPRARIALAYAEWRDWAADMGYAHPSDTPLAYLDRFVEDDEHTEFAWLVTRSMWGDLQSHIDDGMAVNAEELSRALRLRLGAAHPATLRIIALLSRVSVRSPYGDDVAHGAPQRTAAKPVSTGAGSVPLSVPDLEVGDAFVTS